MKIKYTLFLLFAFSLITKAQNWCPAGATWYYTDVSAFVDGYSKFSYVNDTVINSITCKKIEHFYEGTDFTFTHYTGYAIPYFSYEQNGVVYLYNNKYGNNKFDTLFDINAQIGDIWRMPLVDTACVDSLYFIKVINTGTKIINGFNLKWLYAKFAPTNNGWVGYIYDTITEKLGYRYDNIDYIICHNIPSEMATGRLRCYSDSAFGSYTTGLSAACNYYNTGISETQITLQNVTISPNPATNQFAVAYTSAKKQTITIEIINNLGQRLKSIENTESEIGENKILFDVSDLQNGIYFASVKTNEGFLTKKIIVQK